MTPRLPLGGRPRLASPRTLWLATAFLLLLASAVLVIVRLAPDVPPGPAEGGLTNEARTVAPSMPDGLTATADTPGLHERTFWSEALGREMPYAVYLPPGYDPASPRRYPVLYMLHGLGGNHLEEWPGYGLLDAAASLIASGELQPLIIVLPEGEDGYWVDHANGGPAWGTYLARDVVAEIDGRFATLTSPGGRAIGGNSMGAHGAIQLAINFPGVFGVVGVHSPTLRTFEEAPPYFGDRSAFEARDPARLVRTHPEIARQLRIWIDVGDRDPWGPRTAALHQLLLDEGIPHQYTVMSGAHDDEYWTAHVRDYLRFYGSTLSDGS